MIKFYHKEELRSLIQSRQGETKLGESIKCLSDWDALNSHPARFVLIGIAEDIGIRANFGQPGAASNFEKFLPSLLNVQVNRFLDPQQLMLGGLLQFPELMTKAEALEPKKPQDLAILREMTAQIDEEVSAVIERIAKAGKIPIVVGGGHNNSYGLIKGVSKKLKKAIPVLNIDPHADYRQREGRHSGNGFSYARYEGFLDRYAVFGLHENYNNHEIIEQFHQHSYLYYLSFDQLLTFSTSERDRLFKDALRWLGPGSIGLELDLDAISGMPVSAYNSSGLSMRQTRLMIKTAAALSQPYYFHISEGSPAQAASAQQQQHLAKAITYLVTDFIKSYEFETT
jgi:formiminoglutamase